MTCIVGLEYNGRVYIGGDIQGSGRNNKVVHTQPKVFNKNGVLFGYTTSYRFGQVLEHMMLEPVVPENGDEIYRWLITTLGPAIADALRASRYDGGGNCLIGVKGQLWELQNDFSFIRSVTGFNAVGSGTEYAIGSAFTALLTKAPTTQQQAEKVVRDAITAAGTFCPTVGLDSVIIST